MADAISINGGRPADETAAPGPSARRHTPKSTKPMDVVNDVAVTVSQVKGVLEMVITVAETEIDDKNVIASLYALQTLLESAWERCLDARSGTAVND